MKRIIITESEKKNILLRHNLLVEGTNEDQQVMMNFKNKFMQKSNKEIANGLEKMKSVPGLSDDEKSELDQAIGGLNGNDVKAGIAKSLVDKRFDENITKTPDRAKNMLCYLITQNPEYSNPEISSFCSGNQPKQDEKNQNTEIKNDEAPKTGTPAPAPAPAPSNSKNIYSAPGSRMNPYGS